MTLTKDELDLSTKRIEDQQAILEKLEECTKKGHTLSVKRSLGEDAHEVVGWKGHHYEELETFEEGGHTLFEVNLGDLYGNRKHCVRFTLDAVQAIEFEQKSSVSTAENVTFILK